jgi:hypothetical protein
LKWKYNSSLILNGNQSKTVTQQNQGRRILSVK